MQTEAKNSTIKQLNFPTDLQIFIYYHKPGHWELRQLQNTNNQALA